MSLIWQVMYISSFWVLADQTCLTRIRSTAIKCSLFIVHSYSLFQIKGLDEPGITSNVLQAVIKLH